ncbi:hypothetical protein ESCAB7627_3354 [Escherichia albertii TW07627]|uniref:Uncharacterized protein n=1 Tax=Escherichia albertii (strain TW07627) TaxID=502347 RepID=A0ABC9NMI5_ESCAT|nr:hypothetical protein ESCAB7627_3354 [Escherichia albertii TW07627]
MPTKYKTLLANEYLLTFQEKKHGLMEVIKHKKILLIYSE